LDGVSSKKIIVLDDFTSKIIKAKFLKIFIVFVNFCVGADGEFYTKLFC
jgi:hypothetical protein